MAAHGIRVPAKASLGRCFPILHADMYPLKRLMYLPIKEGK